MVVAIIGRGVYGSALGEIIEKNQNTVRFFDKVDGGAIETVLSDAEAVVLAIPSEFVSDFALNFPTRFRHLPFILATKGLLLPDIFESFGRFSALSGPAFAQELRQQKSTTLTATNQLSQKLLQTDWLEIELTDDIRGVMACGTLKNIYAIEAGFRNLRPNSQEFMEYVKTALSEMKKIIAELGGQAETADLACGIGDLILTCGSPKSRNYQFGMKLAQNPSHLPTETTEGLTAIKSLPKDLLRLPLIKTIFEKIVI
ncbi:MAG: hypothetical protein LBE03_00040 [Candidatus Nomurabacteria bacterium]|jgi:glycerol-3-phosphate dehydrogenase (NAD(P)+)|nr:hypothetical protein [Candidatus Nomurabacteria bacterium]